MVDLYPIFRSLAFRMGPEFVHEKSIHLLGNFPGLSKCWFMAQGQDIQHMGSKYELDVAGMKWSFPVGLAAGLDKNGECIPFFSNLLFGAVEIGTVTPLPQEGNPRPRLFRYPKEKSLRNRMGFNNQGAQQVYENILKGRQHPLYQRQRKILGINLGKNKMTPPERSIEDYRCLYQKFAPVGDYLVINVSSPNTPGLRDLQNVSFLEELFQALSSSRRECPCPLFIKLSPDLDEGTIEALIKLAQDYKLSGLMATNTGIFPEYGEGGISGQLLRERSAYVRRFIMERIKGSKEFELIGIGGISSFDDLWEFWRQGGKVVQIYTSFIYQGPSLLVEIKKSIDQMLERHSCSSLKELLPQIPFLKG